MPGKSVKRTRLLLALSGMVVCAGCTGITASDIGILPTSGIRSVDQARTGSYPAVGVTPPLPAPDFTAADRQRIQSELEAARQQNRAQAATPLEQAIQPSRATP